MVPAELGSRFRNPAQLAAFWELSSRNRARAIARRPDGLPSAFLRLRRHSPDRGVLEWEAGGAELESPLALELIGYNSLYALSPAAIVEREGELLLTEIPEAAVRVRRRSSGRARVAGELCLRFRHPLRPELSVERAIRDVSFRGLSYWSPAATDGVQPGATLDKVEVEGPGIAPLRFKARVCAMSPAHPPGQSGGGPQIVGLSLAAESESDWSRWATIVGDLLYPRTRTSCECGRRLWEVFVESGYLNLSGKAPRDFERSRQQLDRVSDSLAAHPELGARVFWLSQHGIEASVSVNKVYCHSWLGHQMVRRSGGMPPGIAPRQALRETFLRAHELAHADPDSRWFVGFIEGNVPWMRAANLDFSLPRVPTGLADVLPFRLREGRSSSCEPGIPGVEVRAATEPDARLVLDAIAAQRSAAYREAFDLVAGRLDLREPRERWARAGMRRDRALRLARVNGRPVAAGIFELSEPGLNLFGILDGVRLFVLPEGEALAPGPREDALCALLADAKAWYAAAGAGEFVYYQERERAPHSERAGLGDLGPGYVWILSTRLLPEWMEHVYELTSPRAPEP